MSLDLMSCIVRSIGSREPETCRDVKVTQRDSEGPKTALQSGSGIWTRTRTFQNVDSVLFRSFWCRDAAVLGLSSCHVTGSSWIHIWQPHIMTPPLPCSPAGLRGFWWFPPNMVLVSFKPGSGFLQTFIIFKVGQNDSFLRRLLKWLMFNVYQSQLM